MVEEVVGVEEDEGDVVLEQGVERSILDYGSRKQRIAYDQRRNQPFRRCHATYKAGRNSRSGLLAAYGIYPRSELHSQHSMQKNIARSSS